MVAIGAPSSRLMDSWLRCRRHAPSHVRYSGASPGTRLMTIRLNHTIVPARDKEAAAGLFAQLFGLSFEGVSGPLRSGARK
jgi:hypothetical protein